LFAHIRGIDDTYAILSELYAKHFDAHLKDKHNNNDGNGAVKPRRFFRDGYTATHELVQCLTDILANLPITPPIVPSQI
jgi:hypothetical protein